MKLNQLKQLFLDYLEIKLGRSAKTIENYNLYLTRFLTFVKVSDPSELTEDNVRKFRSHLNQQTGTKINGKMNLMKEQTQNCHLIALRAFLKFLRQRGLKSVLPERITLAKVPERSLESVSQAQLSNLLLSPSVNTLVGKRDRAILYLLATTGLRISELCSLLVSDVDLTKSELLVLGNGDRVRVVSISKVTNVAIRNYLDARRDTEVALFIRYGKKAHVGSGAKVSPRTVQRLLENYAVKVGIKGKVTPQIIRHSFAINLLSTGRDLSSVQALLGHANIGTTRIYTKAIKIS